MTDSVVRRFRKTFPCPICGGGDDMPRGQGRRCSGYLSSDERFAYCTREEHAGQAPLEQTDPPSWRHFLEGECNCGATHGFATNGPIAQYDYVDEDGQLLYQVVRLAGKQFRQRRPDGNGGWIWNLNATRRVLYHLPGILQAAALGETIYIVEGEKDVHAIEAAGATATCNPGGAGKWKPEYAAALHGAQVVIIADRDKPGLEHAHTIAQTLPKATIVQALKGKDAYDHLHAGHSLDELEPLERPTQTGRPRIVSMLEFITDHEEPPVAVIGERGETLLPTGGLLILGGEGGASKTTLSLDAIAHVASGQPWLGFPVARPVRFLIIENEGPRPLFRDKLRTKREAWNGPEFHQNVKVWEEPWAAFAFTSPSDREYLIEYVQAENIDVVFADPLDSLGIEGAGTPEDVRTFVAHLKECGLHNPERPLSFWLLHHFNKSPGRSVVQQLSGAWGGHPDAILGVELGDAQTTKLTWGKLRHATPPKEKTMILTWDIETRGFAPIDKPEPADVGTTRRAVLAYVNAHPGQSRTAVEEAVYAAEHASHKTTRAQVRQAVDYLLEHESGSITVLAGQAPNAKYLHPASTLGLPLADTPNGRPGAPQKVGPPSETAGLGGSASHPSRLPGTGGSPSAPTNPVGVRGDGEPAADGHPEPSANATASHPDRIPYEALDDITDDPTPAGLEPHDLDQRPHPEQP